MNANDLLSVIYTLMTFFLTNCRKFKDVVYYYVINWDSPLWYDRLSYHHKSTWFLRKVHNVGEIHDKAIFRLAVDLFHHGWSIVPQTYNTRSESLKMACLNNC